MVASEPLGELEGWSKLDFIDYIVVFREKHYRNVDLVLCVVPLWNSVMVSWVLPLVGSTKFCGRGPVMTSHP
jgi:hypothetical protein